MLTFHDVYSTYSESIPFTTLCVDPENGMDSEYVEFTKVLHQWPLTTMIKRKATVSCTNSFTYLFIFIICLFQMASCLVLDFWLTMCCVSREDKMKNPTLTSHFNIAPWFPYCQRRCAGLGPNSLWCWLSSEMWLEPHCHPNYVCPKYF